MSRETEVNQNSNGELNSKFVTEIAPKQGDTIFDQSVEGRIGLVISPSDVPSINLPPENIRRKKIDLPQVSQPEVVRHYTRLSQQNFSIGTGMYPLGSCTMKHNPRIHEEIVNMSGFAEVHPDQPEETIQGTLGVLYGLQKFMSTLTGMDATTLTPMGGAQGEFTGVLMIKAYHLENGEDDQRREMLVPDSAHGTNPATAAMAGYKVVKIETGSDGDVSEEDLERKMGDGKTVAGIMLTDPSTLGLFNKNLQRITEMVHQAGGLVYGDGANENAGMGKVLPRQLGIDVMHINTHKALTTPHGGGGPGAGPVMVIDKLAKFLPAPVVIKDDAGVYRWHRPEKAIGKINRKAGNINVLLRAYSYIRTMGEEGLRRASEMAVTNANFIDAGLKGVYPRKYGADRRVAHEVVISGLGKDHTMGIAKRLIDYGFHPPTVYFPLIVDEAMMIEPTETETLENLERFIEVMRIIAEEDESVLRSAPHFTPVGRLNETDAARKPILVWTPDQKST